MRDLDVGDLHIEVVRGNDTAPMQLMLRGCSNDRQPMRVLKPYFTEALATAAGRQVPLELHFEKLEHFNSSTITVLIELMKEARSKGIKLTYVYDRKLKWQTLSFDAMRVFVQSGLVELCAL
jgi:hypothetical protein